MNKNDDETNYWDLVYLRVFLPIVANADSYTVKSGITLSAIAKERTQRLMQLLRKIRLMRESHLSWSSSWNWRCKYNAENLRQLLLVNGYYTSNNYCLCFRWLEYLEDAAARNGCLKSQVVVIQHKNGQYYGRYQLTITCLWMVIYHLQTKKKVANQYVVNRYGSWSGAKNFWLANGWVLNSYEKSSWIGLFFNLRTCKPIDLINKDNSKMRCFLL